MAYGNYAPFYRGGYFNPMAPQMPPMAENQNQFAQPFQQPPMQPTQMSVPNQPANTNDIIWVQGEAGAKAYLIAPNNTVTLWDSESPTIYVKSADVNGVPSMRVLDFTERTQNAPKSPAEHVCQCGDKFIPKSELNAINGKFDDISGKIEELEAKLKELKIIKTIKTEE